MADHELKTWPGFTGDWAKDSQHWIGRVLTGQFAHYCDDWDGLPVDETTDEFGACNCNWPPEQQTTREAAKKAAEVTRG